MDDTCDGRSKQDTTKEVVECVFQFEKGTAKCRDVGQPWMVIW